MSKPILHQSQIMTFLRCGKQYQFRYVDGLVRPPSVAAVRGTGAHDAVDANLSHKIATGALLDAGNVADAARDGVNKAWEDGVSLDPGETDEKKVRGETVDTAVRLALHHHDVHAPTLEPVHVERPFRIGSPMLPVDLQGTIDLQEPTRLRDLKTAAKSPAKTVADISLQLTMYSMAVKVLDGTAPESIHLDTLVDLKTGPKLDVQTTTRGPDDWKALMHLVVEVNTAIEKGVFLPTTPDNWVCSEKFCGYWKDVCPYGRRNRNRTETMPHE